MQDFESFETFEEILEYVNRAHAAFASSIDFAMMSEGTYEYVTMLWNSMIAVNRITRIKINNHRLRMMKGDSN
jgi:2-hydroxy-3-keto-5-methylthiopentenyl-1-phosphate phosphatase